jgi:hypothetical protein
MLYFRYRKKCFCIRPNAEDAGTATYMQNVANPEELADAIEGLITSAEQAGMSRDSVQSLRQLVTECKDIFRIKLGVDPPANVNPLVIKLCVPTEFGSSS